MLNPSASNDEGSTVAATGAAKTKRLISRRRFLTGLTAAAIGGPAYTYFEAGWLRVNRQTIAIKNLPAPFRGKTLALLTDIHHGPFISLNYIEKAVAMTNQLMPDAVMLTGDYVHRHHKYIDPCFDVLRNLKAPLGVFGVMGNHDHQESLAKSRHAMKKNQIEELPNTGIWVESSGKRLRICGVDDLWSGKPDLDSALKGTGDDESAILLSHNPDYVEGITDSRVGLVLSGHTHGGQAVVPFMGAPIVPSHYGQKYLQGLVETPHTQVYVSRGVGTITPPLRFNCRPEIVLITMTSKQA